MSQTRPHTLVLIGGSLRSQSVNGAVIVTAAEVVAADAHAVIFNRLGDLPHFNPDDDHDPLPEPVASLREHLKKADAVLFSTPEYAGSLPGSLKNLLEWTVGAGSLYRLPVGWINPSAHGGSKDTYAALRIVLNRAGAEIIENACVEIPVLREAVGPDGRIAAAEIRGAIRRALAQLSEAARNGRRTARL